MFSAIDPGLSDMVDNKSGTVSLILKSEIKQMIKNG